MNVKTQQGLTRSPPQKRACPQGLQKKKKFRKAALFLVSCYPNATDSSRDLTTSRSPPAPPPLHPPPTSSPPPRSFQAQRLGRTTGIPKPPPIQESQFHRHQRINETRPMKLHRLGKAGGSAQHARPRPPTPTPGWSLPPKLRNPSYRKRKRCLSAKRYSGLTHQAKAFPNTLLKRRIGLDRQDP